MAYGPESDVSFADLAAQPGIVGGEDIDPGFNPNSANPFGGSSLSDSGLGGLAALGVGAGGLAAILGRGESPLPAQYGLMQQQVPALQQNAATLFGQGQTLTGQGTQALGMAQRGELTDPQKAQIQLAREKLGNTAAQQFAAMGRNLGTDTSAINVQAHNEEILNAMSQEQIRTTIQLGLGELSSGAAFTGQSLAYSNAASNILLQAGEAQLQQDKNYSDSLTAAFTGIGKMFGAAAPQIGSFLSSLGPAAAVAAV